MIVCVCNRLNEAKIRAAFRAGALTPEDVFAFYKVRKNCGRCLETIEEMAIQEGGEPEGLPAPAP
ncbi:MAG: (2Fe-2S)-binding protein [Alphaproteobacteria bacterium]